MRIVACMLFFILCLSSSLLGAEIMKKAEQTNIPPLMGLELGLSITQAEQILKKQGYVFKKSFLLNDRVQRTYKTTKGNALFHTIALESCSVGDMLLAITMQGNNKKNIYAAVQEKLALSYKDTQGEHPASSFSTYSKQFADGEEIHMQATKDGAELSIFSNQAQKNCKQKANKARDSVAGMYQERSKKEIEAQKSAL
jgi:sucrose-6-phosphate hydrolase SacC (GH32 family)